MERGAGDAGAAAAADRGRGQLRVTVAGSSEKARSASGLSSVATSATGNRLRSKPAAAQRLGRPRAPSASAVVGRAAVADLELGLLGRQVGERAVARRPPGRRRSAAGSARPRAPAARSARDERGAGGRVGPVLRARRAPRRAGARATSLEEAAPRRRCRRSRAAAPGRRAPRGSARRPARRSRRGHRGRRTAPASSGVLIVAADEGDQTPRVAAIARPRSRPPAARSPRSERAPANPPFAARSYSQLAMAETVVMKFGGTSVAEPEDIKRAARRIVAAREGGKQVVAVLSARGKTTDDLVAAAYEISDAPARARDGHAALDRRADLLRALRDGDPRHGPRRDLADRLAGGDRHRLVAHQGADHRRARRPHPRRARRGPDRARRRLPGRLRRQPRT